MSHIEHGPPEVFRTGTKPAAAGRFLDTEEGRGLYDKYASGLIQRPRAIG